MYVTTAYLYQQIQTVLLIDTTGVGQVFDRRWRPVYAKNLKLNLGVDNVILFQFQNQDQKPINISGSTFTFRLISQNGENLLYARELVSLNNALGRAKVTIPAADTLAFQAQPASWSIEVASGNLEQAVFTDDYAGARGSIDIVDSVFPAFVGSAELTVPDPTGDSSILYSSVLFTEGRRLTTFQIDTEDFTGSIQVQGASNDGDVNAEWYDIDFYSFSTFTNRSQLDLQDSTARLAINVEGFHPYLRLALDPTAGNISQIIYR
jgi:hypothetical protein